MVWVPTQLTPKYRKVGRSAGKSDPIDALAIAQAALREELPPALPKGDARELKMLVDYRTDLIEERSRMENRLR